MNIKKFHRVVFELKVLKAVIIGVLAGHNVATLTYCVTKMITLTCSSLIAQLLDTICQKEIWLTIWLAPGTSNMKAEIVSL